MNGEMIWDLNLGTVGTTNSSTTMTAKTTYNVMLLVPDTIY